MKSLTVLFYSVASHFLQLCPKISPKICSHISWIHCVP